MNIVKGFKRLGLKLRKMWKLYKEWNIYKDAHLSFFIKKVAEMDDFPAIFSGTDANIIFVESSVMESFREKSNMKIDNISDKMLEKYGEKPFEVLSACTSIEEGRPIIYICEENFRSELIRVTKHFKCLRGTIAAMVLLHEFWHYRQFQYLIEKGAIDLVNKVLEIETLYNYGSSPLETGANKYGNSLGFKKQDFKELLGDNAIRNTLREALGSINFMGKKINL